MTPGTSRRSWPRSRRSSQGAGRRRDGKASPRRQHRPCRDHPQCARRAASRPGPGGDHGRRARVAGHRDGVGSGAGKLDDARLFKQIFVQPAAGDAGGALGAAYAAHYIYFEKPRVVDPAKLDALKGSYLGTEFNRLDIEKTARKYDAAFSYYPNETQLLEQVAKLISEGNIIGWHQGRMEFGPRALGNRSILGDARNPEMQKKLNLKIKYREGFRPFAPSVLAEDAHEYFDLQADSPYMLVVAPVKESRRLKLPDNYNDLPLWERLYHQRSDLQSITHLDFSARVQSVYKETNPRYHALIREFKNQTSYGLVVNTSFNVRGEPIVCTPYDAFRCFMSTEMDYLVIGDFVYTKTEQPDWENKEKWMVKFKMD